MNRHALFFCSLVLCLWGNTGKSQQPDRHFRVLVLAENGGHHILFTKAVKPWLTQLAADSSFAIDYLESPATMDDDFLKRYQLFIQLDYPPYGWGDQATAAFERYIQEGRGGWIGFHHAALLGEFDGYPMWQWFSEFMGEIRYTNYISSFVSGKVSVEDPAHPVMKGVPASFVIEKEEWYTWSKSPRPRVHVLASVDESTYAPDTKTKMGDHPVVWINEQVAARNVYIFMGHTPEHLNNPAFTTLFRNAVFWAARK